MVWLWVGVLRPRVFCLVLVYLIDNSWVISTDVVIHPVRCGLTIVRK
jgi:hypothetical protein